MGNYKSRPTLTCADECKKRISEAYSLVRSRLNDDMKPRHDHHSVFYAAVSQGTLDEFIASFDDRYLDERVPPRDLSLLHLICAGSGDAQARKLEFALARCEDETKRRSLLQQRTPNNFYLLHLAAYKGDEALVRVLLNAGVDVNAFVERAPPPLHLAVVAGSTTIIELLFAHGVDVHARDLVQFTALHCAAFFSQEPALRTLLKCGADPNSLGGVNDRPLHIAAGRQHLINVRLLLDAGADPTLADDEGNVAVHFAAAAGYSPIIVALLAKADNRALLANALNIYNDTPLHSACYHGKLEAAKTLIRETGSESLRIENVFNETPLQAACTAGKSFELVVVLLRQPGADANYQSRDGHTALHSACFHGHLRIVQHLLDNGADQSLTARATEQIHVEKRGHVSSTILALMRLESGGNTRSAAPTLADDTILQQQTPIIWAYEKGHDQIVALLKFYANKRADSDVCSEYSSGDSSYTPLPSPLGKLRSITREKTEVLQLRDGLYSQYRISLMDVELLETIGEGSFGTVYRGVCRGKTVAVKRYRALAFGSKSEVDIFCREASILYKLKHPNVIGFVGACMDDPSQFAIITEYAASGSLFSLLHEQKRVIAIGLRLCIGVDVARGMRYLHENERHAVIHRDLNSHNILLHANGRAVVADFGESRFICAHEEENMTKQPGNLRWMAPELFTQSSDYTEKVDVFSYALVVWEVHAAELPFSHLKPAAAAAEMAYKRSRPSLPLEATPQFPQHILDLVVASWSASATQRPSFAQIVATTEAHAPADDERDFALTQPPPPTTALSTDDGELTESEADEHFEFGVDVAPTVRRLKTQFERISTESPTRGSSGTFVQRRTLGVSNVHRLRQQVDSKGYISQAARSLAAAKSAASLRDSVVLARVANVAQRAGIFHEDIDTSQTP